MLLARVPSLRLCGPGLVPAPVTPRNVQLAALPLVARQDGSVAGVLVLAATDDRLARAESRRRRGSPANSGDNCGGGSAAGTDVNSMMKEVADEVAANFFGSKESRSSAGQVSFGSGRVGRGAAEGRALPHGPSIRYEPARDSQSYLLQQTWLCHVVIPCV